ncbi:helix-turn-helix transcriptional regulator [Cryobacterium sp. 10C3]|uniref:helix-turn-helix domain-containing protein n=1 Tax=Cryobacterium sp. 10C3 TaxID=3048577 RepID=UPI002AB4D490|nr:helix-turn-helix transcriptional regulator [Cryobacterium sp. 10C3]MDY7558486.1 helix-turn-helix transcriptional regulator [Cryobacterium sp. 10C3]
MARQIPIGARLRAARQAKNLTLEAVSTAAGVTSGFLSRMERDQVSPSVSSLVAICDVVGLRVGELFEAPATQIVRAGEGAPINFGGQGAEEFLLTPGVQTHMQVIHSRIQPGVRRARTSTNWKARRSSCSSWPVLSSWSSAKTSFSWPRVTR